MRGVSELARITQRRSRAKYGDPPQRYPELAAIVGETSDNLPGVPGVGQGYAAKWINQFDGLDNVITHADQITGKKGEALREHLGDVLRNRRLNALVCDLDLERGPADLAAQAVGPAHARLHPVRRPRVPGRAPRPAPSTPWSPEEEPVDEGGLRAGRAPGSVPARSTPASSRRPRATSTSGVHGRVGSWGSGTGEVGRVAIAVADVSGLAAYLDVAER